MRIAVPHNTTREIAREKVQQRLQQILRQFADKADDIQHEWLGDTLRFRGKAKGMSVEGTVEVTDAAVIVDGKLPLIARPFEGKIRQAVEQETAAMFKA